MNKLHVQALESIEPHILSAAVINLDNVRKNYREITEIVPNNTQVSGVVKANAYGFGADRIAPVLYSEGCRMFFVATIQEGIDLRKHIQHDADICILSGILAGTEEHFIHHRLTPVLNNPYQAELWIAYAKSLNIKLSAVIHIDTGMFRNGFLISDAEKYAPILQENLNIKLVMSHLSCADVVDHPMNNIQLSKFKSALTLFPSCKSSLAATNGIFLGHEYCFDLVRPGKSLYGFSVREDLLGSLHPVMDLYSRIVHINTLNKGDSIGYGATFVADKTMTTATIGIGYADGFMRKFSGIGNVFIGDQIAPVVGRISMDYITVDISHIRIKNNLHIGSWVALTQSPNHTLEKWAFDVETIPHEIACRIGSRLEKIYLGSEV